MKKLSIKKTAFMVFIVFLTVLMFFFTGCIGIRLYVNQYIKDNYERRIAIWQETANDIPKDCIIFIGDSHTEYFILDEYFPGLLVSNRTLVINRGIFGDTTYGVLNRLDESVFNLNPSKVFLLIDTNDVNKTRDKNEKIVENIIKIALQLRDFFPETEIYIQSLYPVNRVGKNSNRIDIYKLNNKRISEINQLLEEAYRSENLIYVDMFSNLTDDHGNLREEFTIEGLHLNSKGYKYVAEILRQYLE